MAAVGHRTPLRAARLAEAAPWIVLGVGSVLVALSATLIGIRINGLASLDEMVYRVSAVTYTDSFPESVWNDPVARGTARLYPLLLAPIFAIFDGDTAVRVARGLSGVLWASASVPIALLGRRLTGSTWAGVAAGLLSVAVPWITVATLMFSEPLSYALFAWTVYAMAVTLAAPTPRRDLLVLVLIAALIGTRVQFVALPIAWLVVVLIAGHGVRGRERFRRHPFLLGGAALVLLAALVVTVTGRLDQVLTSIGGPYSEIKDRGRPPSDVGVAAGYHGGMVVLGLGFVSGVLLLPWLREAFARRAGWEAYRFAVIAVVVTVALFVITIAAQNGWADGRAEERYYIYAVPFIWCGALAALRSAAVRTGSVVAAGLAVAAVLALAPLTITPASLQAFYGPVGATVGHVLTNAGSDLARAGGWNGGPTSRDSLLLLALIVVGLTALLWARFPRRRWLVLVLPVALQLALTAYALALVRGDVRGIDGVALGSPSERHAWVDRALDGDATAALAENRRSGDDNAYVDAVLWNDTVRSRLRLPSAQTQLPPFPVRSMSGSNIAIGTDLRVTPGLPERVVALRNSPLWQPEGRTIPAQAPAGQELVAPDRPATVRWHAGGIDGDGHIATPVAIAAAPGYRVTLVIGEATPGATTRLDIRLGRERRSLERPGPESPSRVELSTCDARGVTRGTIRPSVLADIGGGRRSAGVLFEAQLEPCSG